MREEFKIEIETIGDYKTKKEFNKQVELTDREWMALIDVILTFLYNKTEQPQHVYITKDNV